MATLLRRHAGWDGATALIHVTTVVAGLAGVGLSVWAGWGSPHFWAGPLVVAATLGGEMAGVRLVIGRQGFSSSLSDIIIAVGLVLAPGAWIVPSVLLGTLPGYYVRRIGATKLSFNLASHALGLSAGVALTVWLHGGIAAAGAGVAMFAVVTYLLTATAVSATSGERYRRVLVTSSGLGVTHSAGNASIGLLAGWLVVHAPLGVPCLGVPLALLWWSYGQQAQRTTEARLFEELARGHEKVVGKSVDTSAQVVVMAWARLFGGAEVEMLLRHPDGPIRYAGDEYGLQSRTRVEPDGFGAPWALRTMAARGVLTGIEGERPFCSAMLGSRERPLAVLIARRPVRAGAFTRSDQRLTEVLVAQAESWLSVADLTARHDAAVGQVEVYGAASRVLGDIGSETAPALTVLRESADRLSRLAYAFDGPDPVSEIVDELHAVERAVASLLGAIALASDPPRVAGTDVMAHGTPSLPRSEAEWTTTGRLEVIETP